MSRPDRPKQLLRLTHPEKTMLEEAIDRLTPVVGPEGVYLSVSQMLAKSLAESGTVPPERVLAEPAKRNTLGALCWLTASLLSRGLAESVVAVVTADHRISPVESFQACVTNALNAAATQPGIVVIGVRPTRPETGYGYIEVTESFRQPEDALPCHRFREKPSAETAEEFLREGRFLWNSGMFFFSLQTFLSELALHLPDAHVHTLRVAECLRAGDASGATKGFEELPNLSVDYAILERSESVRVVQATFEWDDLGAWDALLRTFPLDSRGNVAQGNVIALESGGCVLINERAQAPLGVYGAEHLIVVSTEEGVLVCPLPEAQKVRAIASEAAKKANA